MGISVFLLSSICAAGAFAQSTQPASAPAGADTPKEALTRLSSALHDGDVVQISALIDVPTGPAGKVALAMARLVGGLADLHRAGVETFGEEKAAALVGDTGGAAELSKSAIDSAQIRIDGDHATVTFTNPDQPLAHLVKTDAGWKVELNEVDAINTFGTANAAARTLDHLNSAARGIAKDIRQHKFPTADKAAEALRNQMMQAVSDTQPATQEGS